MTVQDLEALAAYIDAAVELGVVRAIKAHAQPPAIDQEAIIADVLARIPAPKDGARGKDAEPVDVAALAADVLARVPTPDIDAIAQRAATLIPAPENGRDGRDAEPVDVATLVSQVIAQIPAPKDGRDGKDAAPVDKVALAREVLALIPVPKDGRDGIATTDELMAVVDAKVAERLGAAVQLAVDAYAATLPRVEYRGVFKDGEMYDRGNFVTWAGSLWSANENTTEKPGDGSKAWTLAVKRGRDGKDAR